MSQIRYLCAATHLRKTIPRTLKIFVSGFPFVFHRTFGADNKERFFFACRRSWLTQPLGRRSHKPTHFFGETVEQLSFQRNHFASCGFLACGAGNFYCSVAMQKTTTKPFFNCRSRRVAKRLRSDRTDNMVWRSHGFARASCAIMRASAR